SSQTEPHWTKVQATAWPRVASMISQIQFIVVRSSPRADSGLTVGSSPSTRTPCVKSKPPRGEPVYAHRAGATSWEMAVYIIGWMYRSLRGAVVPALREKYR